MIFRFEPSPSAGTDNFTQLTDAIEQYLGSQPIPPATIIQLMIAFDELISNALSYGAAADAGSPPFELVVKIDLADHTVLAEVADNGVAFDPLTLPPPDTSLSVEARPLGGLGVHIVRQLMDDVSYARESGWNRLRFSKTFALE